MINLETPKKFKPLVGQANQVATEVFRPISRKYDEAEHAYPKELDMLASLIDGMNEGSDIGGAGAANQEELHQCLRLLFPLTAGSMHTRVNARWDLATAIKFLEHDLGYKGLYTIEASNGHEGTQAIYDVVVANI